MVSAMAMCVIGCTPIFTENPAQWREGHIVSVVNRAGIPPNVDRHCLGRSMDEGDAQSGPVAIVGIRLGRRGPSYKLAFPLADGQLLHAGDAVIVQPQPCKIKLADSEEI
jgi:hypothetical protein